MTRIWLLVFVLIIGVGSTVSAGPPDSVNWNLIWRDEFNGDMLDTEKWTMGQEWDQEECDYPQVQVVNGKELVEVSNGTLKMKSWKEESGGKPYVGSLVKTRRSGSNPPLFTMHYGYVEVKMRRNVVGEGFHMNAYTFSYDSTTLASSSNGGHVWPSEIDFAETLSREFYRDRILNALHNTGPDEEYWNTGIDWSQWHIYAFNWKEDGYVDFYIDNELVHSSTVPLTPDYPQYLLLRIGIGGWTGEPNEQTEYPGVQEVDWIRAYQKIQNLSIQITEPLSGEVFDPSEDVLITADAGIKNGTINRVEFYADELLLGEATESPYTFQWENPDDGRYVITTRVYDDQDKFKTSGKAYITVGDTTNNLVLNPEFDNQFNSWELHLDETANAALQLNTNSELSGENAAEIVIDEAGTSTAHITLNQRLYLEKDKEYKLSFLGKAEADRSMIVKLHSEEFGNPENYILKLAELTTADQVFKYTFTASKTDYLAKLSFSLGNKDASVFLDSIVLNTDINTTSMMNIQRNQLEIFPNPAKQQINIIIPERLTRTFKVQVFDFKGNKILEQQHRKHPGEIELDVQVLPTGIYMIRITDGNKYFIGKMLKR